MFTAHPSTLLGVNDSRRIRPGTTGSEKRESRAPPLQKPQRKDGPPVAPVLQVRIDADPSASLERRCIANEFGSNVERHRRELLVHCYRMLGSLPDAEDAVQETLLRAWRYRDSVKEGAPLRPWLYRVATNACLESIFVVWFQASSETFQ